LDGFSSPTAADRSIVHRIEPAPLSTEIGSSSTGDSLGSTLRSVRTARGLSLAQVAKETGISRSLLSLIETGRSDITVGRLTRLARLYELRIVDLVPEPRHPDPIVVRADDRQVVHYTAEGIDV
jgi:hypothetical protein